MIPAISAHLAADLIADGEQMPVYVWTIDHPAGRVLIDTGMIDSRPEVDDMSPTPHPENIPLDVACGINTHLDFDHCGGRRKGKEAFDREIENDAFEGRSKLTVERPIEEGDTIVAPHLGEGQLRGGDAFRFAGVTVFGFNGELISRVESYIVPLRG